MIVVNGNETALDGATIAEVLGEIGVGAEARGVAVAVDAEVIPRGEWGDYVIEEGAHVEVVTAVQGG